MENKIPTAEEFAWSQEEDFKTILAEANYQEVYNLMIEFAKLHVEAALKDASENAELKYRINDISCNDKILDKNSILNAYPLTNIK